METILTALGDGEPAQHLTLLQVALRSVIIFLSALIIVRLANKRFFAKKTAFDLILSLILASMMARAINGAERIIPTIVAGFILAFLHRSLGALAYRWPKFGDLVKGTTQTLIVDGEIDSDVLRRHNFAKDDLNEELRLNGIESSSEVKLARLERSGDVSVIKK
jgi:uncharacterized membrane protein YcaP (DUF421 family)